MSPKSWEEQVADKPVGTPQPVALWVVTVLALLIAAGSLYANMKSNREQKSLRTQVTTQQGQIAGLQSSLAAARSQAANLAKADSLKDAKFAAQLAGTKREATDAVATTDSLSSRLADAETKLAHEDARIGTLPNEESVVAIVNKTVAPVIAAQSAASSADSAKLASMATELKNQSDRLNIVDHKTEKSRFQKIWEATVTAVAVTGLFTGTK